jgi:hypothetical protein
VAKAFSGDNVDALEGRELRCLGSIAEPSSYRSLRQALRVASNVSFNQLISVASGN